MAIIILTIVYFSIRSQFDKETIRFQKFKSIMIQDGINKLIAYYKQDFFTEPILLLTFVLCFVLALLYHYNERERLFFLYYFLAGILLFLISSPIDVLGIVNGRSMTVISEAFNTTFELVEFIAFYYFFKKCLQSETFKKISKIFLACLSVISAMFFIAMSFPEYSRLHIREHSLFINVVEFFFLAFLCLAYFYELFTGTPKISLLQRPSFFITASAFFYSVLLIPFFIIAQAMRKNEAPLYFVLFSCHYILLTIMLLSIAKGFLCRKPITT